MTDLDFTANALVRIYTSTGVVPGCVGVLARPDNGPTVAVVAPWPAVLSPVTRFGLALLSPEGAVLDWLQPQRIELFRLEDTALTNTVAVVALETPSKSDGMPVPVDAAAHVLSKLETSKNLIGAMAEAIPQPFEPLSSPAPETVITIDDVARQMLTAVPISPFVGDAPSVVEGICRLLRWD